MSWEPPVLIQRSADRRAFESFLLVDDTQRLHLLWAQNRQGGISKDALRYVVSDDGGQTWDKRADLGMRGGFINSDVGINDCGQIVAVLAGLESGAYTYTLHYSRFDREWSSIEPLPAPERILAYGTYLGSSPSIVTLSQSDGREGGFALRLTSKALASKTKEPTN